MDDMHIEHAPAMPDDLGLADNMDDLFGEAADGLGEGLGVALPPMPALPSQPLPAAVVLRVAEMQRTGCCT